MTKSDQPLPSSRLAGYAALIEQYGIEVIPNWHRSLVATSGIHRIDSTGGVVEEIYPAKYWPGEQWAIILSSRSSTTARISRSSPVCSRRSTLTNSWPTSKSKPTGKYARRLWFLYEFLTGKRLPMEDVGKGNYVDLLDPDQYYTVTRPDRFAARTDQRQSAGRWSLLSDDSPHREPCAVSKTADLAGTVPEGRIPLLAGTAEARR